MYYFDLKLLLVAIIMATLVVMVVLLNIEIRVHKTKCTTADIVHDDLQGKLTGNEVWVRLWATLENVRGAVKLLYVKVSTARFVRIAKKSIEMR